MCAVGAQVCDQWREAAIKAGIPTNEIGIYTGKYGVLPNTTHPLASSATRYTLTTIHRLQADAKRGTALLLANCSTTLSDTSGSVFVMRRSFRFVGTNRPRAWIQIQPVSAGAAIDRSECSVAQDELREQQREE